MTEQPKQPTKHQEIEKQYHLHSRKLTWTGRMAPSKTVFLYKPVVFRVHVSFARVASQSVFITKHTKPWTSKKRLDQVRENAPLRTLGDSSGVNLSSSRCLRCELGVAPGAPRLKAWRCHQPQIPAEEDLRSGGTKKERKKLEKNPSNVQPPMSSPFRSMGCQIDGCSISCVICRTHWTHPRIWLEMDSSRRLVEKR